MRGKLHSSIARRCLACACAAAVAMAAPAGAQGSYSPYNETATAALARYVRALASSPKDFSALIGAGRAALEIGDTQAAAGFFARADEVNPRSPLPHAGMAAVMVHNGEPQAAMPYFRRAEQLGAPLPTIACDRGLAHDLMGQQALAQADYRVALNGPDADEARRRLALSLAISGNQAEALATLGPLMARGDAAAARARAFVLALGGNSSGAMVAIDAAMPGSWARVAPFLQRLPALAPGQKAAAVNLGIFPDSNGVAQAYAAPGESAPGATVASSTAPAGRLSGIEDLLRAAPAQPAPPPVAMPNRAIAAPVRATTQASYSVPSRAITAQKSSGPTQRKVWLQLASGPNADALPQQFQRLKSKHRELFEGIRPYVARTGDRARLLIGPFRGHEDAEIFAEDLETVGVEAFKWSNSETDTIVPIGG